MTDIKPALEQAISALQDITDPLERVRQTHGLITTLDGATVELAAMRRDDLLILRAQGMTDMALADDLGISARRVGQIRASKGGPGPEGALFATPDADAHILVTAKHENERARTSLTLHTHDALVALQTYLAPFGIDAHREAVEPGEEVDLNRPDVIVMMGPRERPLIWFALTADPDIEWRRDSHGQQYLTDRNTGTEYRSDFDVLRPDPTTPPTTCYAHIGRISSPNQRGSFLMMGGVHVQGTVGAVHYLIDNAADVYAKVRRANWSAIVRVTTDPGGEFVSAELATPIYRHGGKR